MNEDTEYSAGDGEGSIPSRGEYLASPQVVGQCELMTSDMKPPKGIIHHCFGLPEACPLNTGKTCVMSSSSLGHGPQKGHYFESVQREEQAED